MIKYIGRIAAQVAVRWISQAEVRIFAVAE
jgi:hypothetical protein